MACKTCRRQDMPEACGPKGDDKCPCCGMQIIARSENPTKDMDNEGRESESPDSGQ